MDNQDKLFIRDLNVRTRKGYLCVRVMRKWDYDGNIPGGSIIYVGLILADEKGDSIYGQIPGAEFHRLGSQLLLDSIYTIRKFSVRVCKPGYVPLDAELMIQFTSFTTITPSKVPANLFPKITYKITPFNQIKTTGESANRYIDVLGIVVAEGPVKTACPKGRDYVSTLKEITIRNLSGVELTVTLWEHHVQQFELPSSSDTGPPHSVVALFCGCVAKKIFNRTQLNAGNACRWFLNPNIPEAEAFYNSLKTQPVPIMRQNVPASTSSTKVQPRIIDHKTLAEMNALDPYDFPEEGYKCTVTITQIPPEQEWWYMGCEVCKKRLRNYGGTYYCAKCKVNGAVPLYKLNFTAADESDQANFFCYDVVGRQIVRRNCDSLLRAINNAPGLPDQIARAVGRTFTFAVGLTDQSFYSMGSRVYSIDSCTFRPDPQTAIQQHPLTITGPSEPTHNITEKSPEIISTHSPHVLDKQQVSSSQATSEQDHEATAQTPPPQLITQETPEKHSDAASSGLQDHEKLQRRSARKRLTEEILSDTQENTEGKDHEQNVSEGAAKKKKTAHTSGTQSEAPSSAANTPQTKER